MAVSQNNLPQEVIKSLETATSLMRTLLDDIKENATSLALLKAKVESLSDSVESLSHVVRDGDGDGSVITRIALVEQSLEHIEKNFDEFRVELNDTIKELRKELSDEKQEERKSEKEFKKEQLMAKLKIIAVIAPGAIALLVTIIKLILGGSS